MGGITVRRVDSPIHKRCVSHSNHEQPREVREGIRINQLLFLGHGEDVRVVKVEAGVAQERAMNYSALKKCDISNGLGWRLSLWCSGCSRHCPQCFNPEAQDPAFGRPFTVETKQKIWRELSDPHCSGLSLLGGEPLYATNRATITDLCREAK